MTMSYNVTLLVHNVDARTIESIPGTAQRSRNLRSTVQRRSFWPKETI